MLCEKCKKNGPKSMIKGNCCHIHQRKYYAANRGKCRAYQREYQAAKRKGGGQGKSKVDYAELFDEMVLKIPQTFFKPKKIQGWSPEKIIRNWNRINF